MLASSGSTKVPKRIAPMPVHVIPVRHGNHRLRERQSPLYNVSVRKFPDAAFLHTERRRPTAAFGRRSEQKMTHTQVYDTDKLRKTLFFDETRCVGARVENLLSGRSVDIDADKVVIV